MVEAIIEAVVLGLYVPIIVFSGVACYLLVRRLILPAMHDHTLTVDRYAIGLSAACGLGAHFFENIYYGVPRWTGRWEELNAWLLGVGVFKTLIMASAIFAVAALSKAATNATHIGRLMVIAGALWAAAAVVAAFVA